MATKRSSNKDEGAEGTEDTYIPADEISVVELVKDIGRQWKVVVGVTALCVVIAFLYTYFKVDYYRYTIELEIGQAPREDLSKDANYIMLPPVHMDPPAFELPSVVTSQVGGEWIPNAVDEVSSELGGEGTEPYRPIMDVSNPGGSSREMSLIIKITADAPKEKERWAKAILAKAGRNAVAQHASYLTKYKERFQARVKRLKNEKEDLESRYQSGEERISELQNDIDGMTQRSLPAAIELHTLMPEKRELSKRIGEVRDSINDLEHKIGVLDEAVDIFELPNLNSEVLEKQQQQAAALSANLSLRPTRVLNLPNRSSKPLGEDKGLIIMLALVLGIGAGLILAVLIQGIIRMRNADSA